MKTWITLSNGNRFDFAAPNPKAISIDAIATGLSNTCRYAGHLPTGLFYSVAEHSVLVSYRVPPELALVALLHDASEGLGMGDCVKPLKNMLPEYERIEETVMNAVATAFEFVAALFNHPEVLIADSRMCATEQVRIRGWELDPMDPIYEDITFDCFWPETARRRFLKRYEEIIQDADNRTARILNP